MGIFGLKAPFSGAIGNGSFFTPKPSFPDFGDFDPCRGSADSQPFPRALPRIGNRPNTISESTVSNTELSAFLGSHRVLGRELSEFRSANYWRRALRVLSSETVLSK